MLSLNDLTEQLPDLLPLPHAISRAITVINDADSSVGQVARVIETDQVLSAKVLRLANSAFYANARPASSVEQALVRIGYSSAKRLLYSAAAWRAIDNKFNLLARLSVHDLWPHSVSTGFCARTIASFVVGDDSDVAYTGGLLHDLGKLALAQFAPKEMVKVLNRRKSGTPVDAAEVEILGFGHAEVGARLLALWGLPEALVESARWHHNPAACLSQEMIVRIVHAANGLSHAIGLPTWPRAEREAATLESIASLGLDASKAGLIITEAELALRGTECLLGLA